MWRWRSSTNITSLDTRGCGGRYKTDTSSKSTCNCVPVLGGLDDVSSVVEGCSTLGEFDEGCSLMDEVGDEGVKKSNRRNNQSDPVK
jgi:hypothetical protein